MKNKKLTALILCITMLFSITSGIFSAAFASDGTTGSAYSLDTTTGSAYKVDKGPMLFSTKAVTSSPSSMDYSGDIGKTAVFDIANQSSFLMYNNPSSFDYEDDWSNDNYWLNTGTNNKNPDVTTDNVMVIVDYYWDEATTALWYQVEAADGSSLPAKMIAGGYDWLFQDYTDPNLACGDVLILYDPPVVESMVGKTVQFKTDIAPSLYASIGGTEYGTMSSVPNAMIVIEQHTDEKGEVWYYVDAVKGETWPTDCDKYHYVKETDVIVVEQKEEDDEKPALETNTDNKTFAIYDENGALPAGAALTVETSEDGFVEFVREGLFGSSTLPDGLYDMAYDISIGDEKLVDGRTVKVRIGNIETAGKDFLVIHLPGELVDGVLDASTIPEPLEVIVGNGYIEFETSGFSNYYVVSGDQGSSALDGLLDALFGSEDVEFYILRESSVTIDAYFSSISYNGNTWGQSEAVEKLKGIGINFKFNNGSGWNAAFNSSMNFSTTSTTPIGTYTIKALLRSYYVHVISIEDMLNNFNAKPVYFKVLRGIERTSPMSIPSEPLLLNENIYFNYITSLDGFSADKASYKKNTSNMPASEFLNLEKIIGSEFDQSIGNNNIIGIVDSGKGADTLACINIPINNVPTSLPAGISNEDYMWNQYLINYVTNAKNAGQSVWISANENLTAESVVSQLDETIPMVNENGENIKDSTGNTMMQYRYQMYPYVIKLHVGSKDGNDASWQVECAIIDNDKYEVRYDFNFGISEAQIIPFGDETVSIPNVVYYELEDDLTVGSIKVSTNDSAIQYPELTIKNGGTDETFQYKFVKWNTKADGTGDDYLPGETIMDIDEDITLYAIWQKSAPLALTITTTGSSPIDAHQSYIFNVSGSDGLNMDVVLHGDATIVITNLKSGVDYTVKPKSNWSWRYTMTPTSQTKRVGGTEAAIAEFSCNRSIGKAFWLDGNAWRRYFLLDSSNNIITEALPVPESSSVSLALIDMALRENDADEDLEVQLA